MDKSDIHKVLINSASSANNYSCLSNSYWERFDEVTIVQEDTLFSNRITSTFHTLVDSNPKLMEQILLYVPGIDESVRAELSIKVVRKIINNRMNPTKQLISSLTNEQLANIPDILALMNDCLEKNLQVPPRLFTVLKDLIGEEVPSEEIINTVLNSYRQAETGTMLSKNLEELVKSNEILTRKVEELHLMTAPQTRARMALGHDQSDTLASVWNECVQKSNNDWQAFLNYLAIDPAVQSAFTSLSRENEEMVMRGYANIPDILALMNDCLEKNLQVPSRLFTVLQELIVEEEPSEEVINTIINSYRQAETGTMLSNNLLQLINSNEILTTKVKETNVMIAPQQRARMALGVSKSDTLASL